MEKGYLGPTHHRQQRGNLLRGGADRPAGGAWWAAIGTAHSSGNLSCISVSGDCAYLGIYEYPLGITVAQVLHDCGARNVQAVQIGGPQASASPRMSWSGASASRMSPRRAP